MPASGKPKAAAKATPAALPSLRFYHSVELRVQTLALLETLESAEHHPAHGQALADLVQELINAGMEHYFLRALKLGADGGESDGCCWAVQCVVIL